jgi:hypothetical protein
MDLENQKRVLKLSEEYGPENVVVLLGAAEAEAAKWLTKEQLDSVAWLPADVTLIEKIRRNMEN